MKYHNDGVLRVEQDMTLRLTPESRKRKLSWVEYLPVIVLGILLLGILVRAFLG